MIQYLIFKRGVHVATANSPNEANKLYLSLDADDIKEFENDAWQDMLSDD